MSPSYSLAYYTRLFEAGTPSYWDLVQALAEELEDYARELGPVLAARDREAFARLRHAHRPLLENLKLASLLSLELELDRTWEEAPGTDLAGPAQRLSDEARAVASALTSERLPGGPMLR